MNHFFGDAKREGWFAALIFCARQHPRVARTVAYCAHWETQWMPVMPLYHRHFEPGQLQFITTSTYRRAPIFSNPAYCQFFVKAFAPLAPNSISA
ncbi:MAG: hypothetical protein ACRD2O_09385 [Terriglobia bacterium]